MRISAIFWASAASAIVTSMSHHSFAEALEGDPLPPLVEPTEAPAQLRSPTVAQLEATICLAGDHTGIKAESARAAFGVVCDSLRKAGAPVGALHESFGSATSAYRINLQRLDKVIILRVTYESPVGHPIDSRSLNLNGLDEVLVASDRVAQALVHGKPIEETATVDTLVGTETRKYEKKSGEGYWGFGLYGMAIPALGVYSSGGLEIPAWYETPSIGVGGSIRFALTGGADTAEKRATFGSLSFGIRGFLTDGDIAPYLGAGLGFDWTDMRERTADGSFQMDGETEGFGAYGEVGVALLRLHKTRFLIGARADVPFFSTKMSGFAYSPYPAVLEEKSRYVIPISLNVTFMPFRI